MSRAPVVAGTGHGHAMRAPTGCAFADNAPDASGHTHKKPEQAMQRLLRRGTGSGGRTHTVAHRNLNPARLPIPPYPLIQFCSILIWDRDIQVTTGVRKSALDHLVAHNTKSIFFTSVISTPGNFKLNCSSFWLASSVRYQSQIFWYKSTVLRNLSDS